MADPTAGSISIEPTTSALVLVDLQQGIVSQPLAPHDKTVVIANCRRLATAFRARGGLVILVRVDPGPDANLLPHPRLDQDAPRRTFAADWAQLVAELADEFGDTIVTKHQWSAFHGTDLDVQLRRRGIKTIILAGISTNMGVESTARAALDHGYDQVFAEDAMTAHFAEDHTHTVERLLPRVGRVRNTDQVLQAIGADGE